MNKLTELIARLEDKRQQDPLQAVLVLATYVKNLELQLTRLKLERSTYITEDDSLMQPVTRQEFEELARSCTEVLLRVQKLEEE